MYWFETSLTFILAIAIMTRVDTLTEERILAHLAGVMRGRTVILISHRVSTVR